MKVKTAEKIVELSRRAERITSFISACKSRTHGHALTAGYGSIQTLYIPNETVLKEARKQLREAKAELKALMENA